MSESEEPDWLAKGGEAMRRELLPLVRAVDQIVRDARLAKASGGPALPLVQRVALIADANLNGGCRQQSARSPTRGPPH